MTNFHDLKTRDLSPKENEVAVEMLAAWLYAYSASFDYDNATVADARIVAASILAEAASLCEDEGCPQAVMVHVCNEVVPTTQTNDQIAAVMLMHGDKGQVAEALAYSRGGLTRPRISSRESEQIGRSFGFVQDDEDIQALMDRDRE